MNHILIVQFRFTSNNVVVSSVGEIEDLTIVVSFRGWESCAVQSESPVLNVCGIQDAAFKFSLAAEVPVVGGITTTRGEWFTNTYDNGK